MGEYVPDYNLDESEIPEHLDLAESSEDFDPSDYKLIESSRIKEAWEKVIEFETDIRRPLTELDHILTRNSHELEAHISGEDYIAVSNGEKNAPERLILRAGESPDELNSVDNHFFQNLKDEDTLYMVGDTRVGLELGDPYDETVDIATGFDNLDIRAPTHESFFNMAYTEALVDISERYEDPNLDDLFSDYF